jgi:Protein of unknown function (DUF3800)
MARLYIFADEAGDFNFSRQPRASKFFIVCTVSMHSCEVAHDLLALRRELAWKKRPLGGYFHASEDKQEIRDEVFNLFAIHEFFIHAQVMEKSKAQLQIRSTNARFYQHGWLYLLRHGTGRMVCSGDEVLVTTAALGTKKRQRGFSSAVNDVAHQTLGGTIWSTHFCPSATDPCLQVADYCTWAIQRKWEMGDSRSYNLISRKIAYEYDLWAHGARHYY